MRPLIEMLEDERTLIQKQEMIYRFIERGGDEETFDILSARMTNVTDDLDGVRDEMKEYFEKLLG